MWFVVAAGGARHEQTTQRRPRRARREAAFRSAQEIARQPARSGHRIGLTTVYRALQNMAEADEVDVLAQRRRRGHLPGVQRPATTTTSCAAACGTTVEVEGKAVETWAERVAPEHGFVDVAHTMEVVGTCRSAPPAARTLTSGVALPCGTT